MQQSYQRIGEHVNVFGKRVSCEYLQLKPGQARETIFFHITHPPQLTFTQRTRHLNVICLSESNTDALIDTDGVMTFFRNEKRVRA